MSHWRGRWSVSRSMPRRGSGERGGRRSFSVGGQLTNPNVEFFSILWRSTSSSQGVQRLSVTTNDCN